MDKNAKIYVAGGQTLIGSSIISALKYQGYQKIISEVDGAPDLENMTGVDKFFQIEKPDYVFLVAGKSGGIGANQKYPADLIRDNLLVQCHIIHSAYLHNIRKLLYLASSCSYPRLAPQPMHVSSILTGSLEPTNEAYAVAKIAGIKMCQAYRQQYGVNFITGIPANVFGPGDDFDPDDSHVIAALIRRMHDAKQSNQPEIEIWGTGKPRREFIYTDDLAEACIFVLENYNDSEVINLGGGTDLSISELAEIVRKVVGYQGELKYNLTRPDGMPLKALDSSRLLNMGWRPRTSFFNAIEKTYDWFLNHN